MKKEPTRLTSPRTMYLPEVKAREAREAHKATMKKKRKHVTRWTLNHKPYCRCSDPTCRRTISVQTAERILGQWEKAKKK